MNTDILNQKGFVFILVSILMVTFGTQSVGYAQAANPTITASVQQPLTEATLHESVVTLTLIGGRFVNERYIRRALSVSGIDGVTIGNRWRDVERVSDTLVTIVLIFSGNMETDATLTLTVGAGAIADYDGNTLIATLPVTAVEESLDASTAAPLTEATLDGSIITLNLNGRWFAGAGDIRDAVSVSGIEGVTTGKWSRGVRRVSDTEVTIELEFVGNIDTDATLTLTVGADAINYDKNFTFQFPVTAVEESLDASTAAPLTEATLDGSIIALTLTGRQFADDERDISRAISFSGIDGVTPSWDVKRVSDTVATVPLKFSGNIDTDAILTLTVGAEAIVGGYDKPFTFQFPVTAVEESLTASTAAPLTEATLHGSIITLSLNGRQFAEWWTEEDAVSVSGIESVTLVGWDVERVNDTVATVRLAFSGNIDTDATLTLTVAPGAIVGGYDKDFIFQFPVTAMEESLEASTEVPLSEATLHGSIITLTLTGRWFEGYIGHALSVSGIEGVTFEPWNVERVSDTVATVELEFAGNIDTDATLTLTVGAEAIVGGYDKDFTFRFPVTAVEESLEASMEAPLTEANLNGSIITLTLSGRRFTDRPWDSRDAVAVSGIDGVTLAKYGAVRRVSDTVATVELEFDGTDFDTDATLTLTVGADAISYNKDFTFQFPVTAIQNSNATVSISPASVVCLDVGETLTFSLNIVSGENIAGYQATLSFNRTALQPVNITNGDYLPMDAFFFNQGARLAATTLAEAANGDGTLATLTFEVEDFKPSTLTLSQFYLVDVDGKRWEVTTESAEVTIPPEPENAILGDLNRDGVVNIQDLVIVNARFGQRGPNSADINGDGIVNIVDLVSVAGAFGNDAAAPALHPQSLEMLTAADIQRWLLQAQQLELTDATSLRGIRFLQ